MKRILSQVRGQYQWNSSSLNYIQFFDLVRNPRSFWSHNFSYFKRFTAKHCGCGWQRLTFKVKHRSNVQNLINCRRLLKGIMNIGVCHQLYRSQFRNSPTISSVCFALKFCEGNRLDKLAHGHETDQSQLTGQIYEPRIMGKY